MATQAQIEANRRNSQKSTGPRSAAGKAASSQNALRHGLYAQSIVIDDENAPEFEALHRDYFDDCNPQGARESALVLELVRCDWLLRRTTALETQLWNATLDDRREWLAGDFDESVPLATAFGALKDRLVLIQRRLSALGRSYHRALDDLRRLQSARAKPPRPAAPENGFVPSKLPPAPASRPTAPANPADPCPPGPQTRPPAPRARSADPPLPAPEPGTGRIGSDTR